MILSICLFPNTATKPKSNAFQKELICQGIAEMDFLGHRSNAVCIHVPADRKVVRIQPHQRLHFTAHLTFFKYSFNFFDFPAKSVKISDTKFKIPILFFDILSMGRIFYCLSSLKQPHKRTELGLVLFTIKTNAQS